MDEDTDSDVDSDNTNLRICICDRQCRPAHCDACTSGTQPCPKHVPILCSTPTCNNQFHLQCLINYGHARPADNPASIEYKCMECQTGERARTVDIAEGDLRYQGSLAIKLRRIGIALPQNANTNTKKRYKKIYKDVKDKMEDHMLNPPHRQPAEGDTSDFRKILDTDPKSLPCPVNMNKDARETADLAARRFTVSMQLFGCRTCDCCGLTKLYHDDPTFPDAQDCPFRPRHLVNGYERAWKCECNLCDGARYFGAGRPKVIDFYRRDHRGRAPWEVLRLDKNEPNAWLCAKCYREHDVAEDRFNGEVNLDSSYLFSNIELTHNQLSSSHHLQSSNYPCGSLNVMVLVKYLLRPTVKPPPRLTNRYSGVSIIQRILQTTCPIVKCHRC